MTFLVCWIDASANGSSDMRHNAKRVRPKQQYIVKKSQQEAGDSASAMYDAIAGTCSQQGLQGCIKCYMSSFRWQRL